MQLSIKPSLRNTFLSISDFGWNINSCLFFFFIVSCFLLHSFLHCVQSNLQNKTLLIFSFWLLLPADVKSHSQETPSPNKCTCKGEKGLTVRWGLSLSRLSIPLCLVSMMFLQHYSSLSVPTDIHRADIFDIFFHSLARGIIYILYG